MNKIILYIVISFCLFGCYSTAFIESFYEKHVLLSIEADELVNFCDTPFIHDKVFSFRNNVKYIVVYNKNLQRVSSYEGSRILLNMVDEFLSRTEMSPTYCKSKMFIISEASQKLLAIEADRLR